MDNDQAVSSSLSSTIVLDLWTDRIVAEYTGRNSFADDNFEIVRLLCLFYNAKCLYEAHPYSQKVYTPNGIKLWRDITIGSKLFSPTKGVVTVTDIPIDTKMEIYKITLIDGRTVEASSDHIWAVYVGTSRQLSNLTTKQLLEMGLKNKYNQNKFFIPENNGVEYPDTDLLIDPYTMGIILSEGSIRGSHCTKNNIQISSSYEDMQYYLNYIPYEIKHLGKSGTSWNVRIPNCKKIMQTYNLYGTNSHSKFIPENYLYSSRSQRLELLKGLMDGDGCSLPHRASIYITCSKKLAEDILLLIRSLGMKAWLQTSRSNVYRIAIATQHKIFKLPRKLEKQHLYSPNIKGSKSSALLYKTAIESIEFSHIEYGKCVTVNSEDGLYMIGDYITTHNCNKKGLYAYLAKMSSTHLLADTPEYLRDKQLIKYSAFGSNQKGVNATAAVNNYANGLIRDWLLKPTTIISKTDEGEKEVTTNNLFTLRNRALIEELIAFNPEINVDRVRALGILMLYREEKMILYQGDPKSKERIGEYEYLENDPYFVNNYDAKFLKEKINSLNN